MKNILIAIAASLVLFTSCIPTSVHPFYTDQSVISYDNIVGTWNEMTSEMNIKGSDPILIEKYKNKKIDQDSVMTLFNNWTISKTKTSGVYDVKLEVYRDNNNPLSGLSSPGKYFEEHFIVHSFKVGENIFLDFYPNGEKNEEGQLLQFHLVPTHGLARVNWNEDQVMFIEFLDSDKLEELLERQMIRIKHEKTDDITLITAKTEDLQKFLWKFGSDDSFFIEEGLGLTKAL